jgi:signal transduction histidine kinase/CheY-like chemotaxis protein/HPt (histidine-containing phosphotransfer) domain-containing protein
VGPPRLAAGRAGATAVTTAETGAASSGGRSTPSIRRRLGALLTTLGLLVGALLVVTTLQLRGSGEQTRAENQRHRSFLVADGMRQSSDDLTNMVRLHVATGQLRYRDYYDEVLAIRSGTAPLPLDYDSSFWHRVLAEGKGFVRYGPPESLIDQMRAAGFTADEFDALNASLQASDGLADVEREVMDRVEKRIARGVDPSYFADVSPEYQRLVDAEYLAQKAVIMDAISDFVARVDARTLRALEEARATRRVLAVAQMAILGLIALAALAAMLRASRVVLRPLAELAAATQRFAAGDYQQRVRCVGVSELEKLAGAFNSMATAVQSDVERRQLAEREALEARMAAEEANRAKSTFVAAMSHEIRTPMIGVTGMLEVLAQTSLDDEQRSMVATAQGSAQVLLQIIGDILDFSKIEAGKLELAPAPFMVRPLAEAAGQTFFHTASAKGLWLSCKVDDRVAAAHVGDSLRIRQIVSNFISNAIKFTSSGGVTLAVRALGGDGDTQRLEFCVADTGMGVAPERQRELFQEFAQGDLSTASRSGGTGLGLVICRRLATLMGGDVTMESAPGQGTTLRLTVPLLVANPDDVAAEDGVGLGGAALLLRREQPSREVAEREGSLLLLAEDHPINRRVLVHQLGIIGFHVDTAEDGAEALELFLAGRYGLVLTDLNMPVMDGFELASAIRQKEAQAGVPRIPILALSANVVQGEAERCTGAGMDDFVGKPASMPVLAEKLRHWMPHIQWADTATVARANGSGAPMSPPEHDAVIDRAVLDEVTGGDDELAAAILLEYLDSSRSDLAALRAAVADASGDEVRREAHRIKGASQTVGAQQVTTLAARLEAAAATGADDWPALRATAEDLEAAMARVMDALPTARPAG